MGTRTISDSERPQVGPQQRSIRKRITLVVVSSLLTGLIVAALLVVMPILPSKENVLTGAVLLGFASGWALLAVLSDRLTDQPQRWTYAPAAFLAVSGIVSVTGSAPVQAVFGWIWPPVLLALAIWMIRQIRRHLHGRIARWLLYPIVAVLAVAAICGSYETVREALDARAYPPPGQLVDVGGHRLHLSCTGVGSPTVILEPGLGASSSDMSWIAPVVAQDTRVCVYDRAGRGWSDPIDGPQDADQIAADLHTLLTNAHVDGPYVLAGHSFGGLYVRDFAAHFPDQVAGVVLLDSSAQMPGQQSAAPPPPNAVVARTLTVVPAVAHLGVGRMIAQGDYDTLPPRNQAEALANASTARRMASTLQEYLEGAKSRQLATALTDLGSRPLIAVSSGSAAQRPAWQAAQEHLTTLSTNAVYRTAPNSTHVSMLRDQADSAAASQAIRDVVASVRSGRPLPAR